jgi:hypothetical protein
MLLLLHILDALFVLLSFLMLFIYRRTRHRGLLIMSMFYGMGGMLSGYLNSWWPLAAGFVLAWLVRLMGLDPDVPRVPRESTPPPPEDNAGGKQNG